MPLIVTNSPILPWTLEVKQGAPKFLHQFSASSGKKLLVTGLGVRPYDNDQFIFVMLPSALRPKSELLPETAQDQHYKTDYRQHDNTQYENPEMYFLIIFHTLTQHK